MRKISSVSNTIDAIKIWLFALLSFAILCICACIPYNTWQIIDNNTCVTNSEFDNLISYNNPIISTCVSVPCAVSIDGTSERVIDYRLFNTFTVKRLRVKVLTDDVYYSGGECIGLMLNSVGMQVIGTNFILTPQGLSNPANSSSLAIGDTITHINDTQISSIQDIAEILSHYSGNDGVKITFLRAGEEHTTHIYPAYDVQTKTYKLGLWVKNETLGLGTLTFVNATTTRFGALGHSVNGDEQPLNVSSGQIFDADVLGVKIGSPGKAGELIGTFNQSNPLGSVDKNTIFGVYGNVYEVSDWVNGKNPIELGGRLTAVPGKASIICSLDGETIKEYDIEIIKTNFQNAPNQKSMVIRVTDKELLSKTGGIVQGMSGSPIIQNGKLVGAVTHVFINDSSKGFGLYIDWMINQ